MTTYEVARLLHVSQVRVSYLCRLHQIGSRDRLSEEDLTQLRERLMEARKVRG